MMRRRDLKRLEGLALAVRVEAEQAVARLRAEAGALESEANRLRAEALTAGPAGMSGADLLADGRWRAALRARADAADAARRALTPRLAEARADLSAAIAREEAVGKLLDRARVEARQAMAGAPVGIPTRRALPH